MKLRREVPPRMYYSVHRVMRFFFRTITPKTRFPTWSHVLAIEKPASTRVLAPLFLCLVLASLLSLFASQNILPALLSNFSLLSHTTLPPALNRVAQSPTRPHYASTC